MSLADEPIETITWHEALRRGLKHIHETPDKVSYSFSLIAWFTGRDPFPHHIPPGEIMVCIVDPEKFRESAFDVMHETGHIIRTEGVDVT